MGNKINELFKATPIKIDDLQNKTLVVDSYNQLYMFLSSIRQSDGGLLTDSRGNVTSHLSGLFNRFTRLMKHGVNFIFVFDGKAPALKQKERERRKSIKLQAEKQYEAAKEKENLKEMKKYAARTSVLTKEMIDEAKKLIIALGFPVVQAKGEGEAQAAFLLKQGKGYALLSQDADAFLFGAPLVIKNLTITGKRKQPGVYSYSIVTPEKISLTENLSLLNIDQDQLIAAALLTGTDYDIGGIKGIGPKKALALIKQHGKDFDTLFNSVKWNDYFEQPWKEVFNAIKQCEVNEQYELSVSKLDKNAILELLVQEHDFNKERVEKTLDELNSVQQKPKEDLTKWF
ncbi:flap endonuclease-1 [Candidatus Woesearchaeota archaeon]|nr:MAG: flap endonuclease-1 [Candidatus Woesearchaeota archaeon]